MPVIGGIPDVIPKTVIYATDFSLCSRSAGFFCRTHSLMVLGETASDSCLHALASCYGS